jgi:tetratricopeptide (TPR) repeat protein
VLDTVTLGLGLLDQADDPTAAADLYANKAWALLTLNDNEGAAAASRRAAELLPASKDPIVSWRVLVDLGIQMLHRERTADAVRLFQAAADAAPSIDLGAEARMFRASAESLLGKTEEALAEFAYLRPIMVVPGQAARASSWLWLNGELLCKLDRAVEGVPDLLEALRLRAALGAVPRTFYAGVVHWAIRIGRPDLAELARHLVDPPARTTVTGRVVDAAIAGANGRIEEARSLLEDIDSVADDERAGWLLTGIEEAVGRDALGATIDALRARSE